MKPKLRAQLALLWLWYCRNHKKRLAPPKSVKHFKVIYERHV